MLHHLSQGTGSKQIIFIHGNSASRKSWDLLLNQVNLKSHFKLIAVDLPGHGLSFRSDQASEDYTLKGLAKYTLEFIKEFEKSPYVIVANSLGSNIIAEIALQLKNCKGIFVTGSCLLGKGLTLEHIFCPNPNVQACFEAQPSLEQIDSLVEETVFSAASNIKQMIKQDFLNTDPLLRTALGNTIATQDYSDELQNLQDTGIPLAFVFGEDDKLCQVHYLDQIDLKIWRNKVQLIKDSGHFSHLDQPEKMSDLLHDFASDVF
jgi:pimeloyl-ACP methyl ester carboxylesterase